MNPNTDIVGSNPKADPSSSAPQEIDRHTLDREKEAVLRDLKAAVEDAQALMNDVSRASAGGMNVASAALNDSLAAVKTNFHKLKNTVEEKARHAGAVTDKYVSENPWKSMGFASAAGVCVSMVLFSASMATLLKSKGGKK